MSAALEDGTSVAVETLYPFGDDVHVTVTVPRHAAQPQRLLVRVPGWAAHAVYSVDGGTPRLGPTPYQQ